MACHRSQAEDILQKVLSIAKSEGKLSGFCIGNTAKVDGNGLFFTPIRNTSRLVAGSVIVYEVHHAADIARIVDGRVDYIFVDTEKKVGPEPEIYGSDDKGNIERAVRDTARRSTVLTFKGNDLTVDAIDCLLSQLINDPIRGIGGKKAAILGAGNLGCKLALKLVERGVNVVITRRDKAKLDVIVQALNFIKPVRTVASIAGTTNNLEAAQGAHILLGMTHGVPVITPDIVDSLHADAIIMDGGKGCMFPDALDHAHARGFRVLRVDIRAGFEGHIAMVLEMERLLKKTVGRRSLNGVNIVSGGLLGWKDEIVVDNIHQPRDIFGVADGRGDFLRQLGVKHQKDIEALKEAMEEETI